MEEKQIDNIQNELDKKIEEQKLLIQELHDKNFPGNSHNYNIGFIQGLKCAKQILFSSSKKPFNF